jgi:hypothetical protein
LAPEPAEPVVPPEPPLELLQPTVEVTPERRKPAPARPMIPKNARILNSFMSFLRKDQKLFAFIEARWGRTLMPISTVA